MKIIYLANFENIKSNRIEEDIKSSLEELGHEVIPVHERDYKKVLDIKADMLLFHKAGIGRYCSMQDWILVLNHVVCKKVMWFFDPIKLSPKREDEIEIISEYIDYGFLVDDTWRRRHKFDNLYSLKEGIGTVYKGKFRKEYECDVAFIGSLYGDRELFVGLLAKEYKEKFRAFNNVYGQDLADLCVSAKVIVAPDTPTNEFYWSSRFYLTLGLGGFLVHPDCYGLKEEFKEGSHFAGYKDRDEMFMIINYYLEHEEYRKAIQEQGQRKCLEIGTFKNRLKTMLDIVFPYHDDDVGESFDG